MTTHSSRRNINARNETRRIKIELKQTSRPANDTLLVSAPCPTWISMRGWQSDVGYKNVRGAVSVSCSVRTVHNHQTTSERESILYICGSACDREQHEASRDQLEAQHGAEECTEERDTASPGISKFLLPSRPGQYSWRRQPGRIKQSSPGSQSSKAPATSSFWVLIHHCSQSFSSLQCTHSDTIIFDFTNRSFMLRVN